MAALLIRDLDDDVKEKLKLISKANGRSLEAQVRYLLTREVHRAEYAWLNADEPDVYQKIRQSLGDVWFDELTLPVRDSYPSGVEW